MIAFNFNKKETSLGKGVKFLNPIFMFIPLIVIECT